MWYHLILLLDLHQKLIFFLAIYTDELLSVPKIITFLLQSKFASEKSERESNSIPYPE